MEMVGVLERRAGRRRRGWRHRRAIEVAGLIVGLVVAQIGGLLALPGPAGATSGASPVSPVAAAPIGPRIVQPVVGSGASYFVPPDLFGQPAAFTVVASGYAPGSLVYIEQCDGLASSDKNWTPVDDCDLGTSPAAALVAPNGTATFLATDANHHFKPFRGVSPQELFSCLSVHQSLPVSATVPQWRDCQLRVSSNNAVATTDQVFLPMVLPDPMVTSSADERFIRAAFADFLAAAPPASQLSTFVTAMAQHRLTQAGVVWGLANTPAWVSTLVQRLYLDTLGRPGDAAGVTYWVNQIERYQEAPASVAASFYASQEYFTGLGGGTVDLWLRDLYQKLLFRAPDASGLSYWTQLVAARGRTSVARTFYNSLESCLLRVQTLYGKLLGRASDSGGAMYWAGRVATDGDLALAANLAASREYYQRAQTRFT